MVTIVLADDHAIVRQGLRALLESDPQLKVVGEAADGREALELVKRRKPALLISDLMMPGLNGLELTGAVRRLKSRPRVVLLSMYREEAYVLEALGLGAAGYVAKESSGAELFTAIRETMAGRRYLSPSISDDPIDAYSASGTILQSAKAAPPDPYETLTSEERTVLRLVVEGASLRDKCARLRIGRRAVETHRAALMRKLGLHTRPKLIRYALQRGIKAASLPASVRRRPDRSGVAR